MSIFPCDSAFLKKKETIISNSKHFFFLTEVSWAFQDCIVGLFKGIRSFGATFPRCRVRKLIIFISILIASYITLSKMWRLSTHIRVFSKKFAASSTCLFNWFAPKTSCLSLSMAQHHLQNVLSKDREDFWQREIWTQIHLTQLKSALAPSSWSSFTCF